MQALLVVISLLASLTAASTTLAGQNGCPVFAPSGELYIFGSPYGDLNLGKEPTGWQTPYIPSGINITALPSRPPFTTANLICLPSFFLNSVLFINADPNDSNTIHEYFYDKQRWRKISTTGLIPNPDTVKAVIDFDTLVIYAFVDGRMVRLGDASTNNLSHDLDLDAPFSLEWIDANMSPVPFVGYSKPTMAHAWFNMYFFGVPGTKAGEVWGYRIHYNEWGLAPQAVGATFPSMHGQTATFLYKNASQFEHNGAPAHVAYIPDDYSGLWVINSYINQTTQAATPPSAGTNSLTRYTASYNILVQYTPDTGVLRFLDLSWLFQEKPLDPTAKWVDATILNNIPKVVAGVVIGQNNNPQRTTATKSSSLTTVVGWIVSLTLIFSF
ncbi:UNVERIFIED_CONTAM: hypothetical protein HDU68_009739 [Siphonaria sp. JEL0065]|nr:hypothetical protein HDU68_009739 [Siphonaria sp. JEL0065]